jgi:hypothetical protein
MAKVSQKGLSSTASRFGWGLPLARACGSGCVIARALIRETDQNHAKKSKPFAVIR